MSKRLTGSILALALCMGAAAEVHAQTSCVVLGVEALNAPPPLADRLSKEIASRVKNSPQFTLTQVKDLEEVKLIFGCLDEDPACMANAGKSLNAEKLIWGTLKMTPEGYNFTIKLLDVQGARVEKFLSENYTAQQLDESQAAAVVARLTGDFLVESRGAIQLTSNRPGAQIFLGDRAVGITEQGPLVINDILPGTHTLRVTQEGCRPWSQEIIIESGRTLELRADLELLAGGVPVPATQPVAGGDDRRGWKIAFWTGLAVTLASTIVATPMGIQAWAQEDDLQNLIKEKYIADPTYPGKVPDICEPDGSGWLPPKPVQDNCSNGQTKAALSTAFFITAGVAAVATAVFGYMAFAGGPSAERADPPEPAEERTTWRLTPAAGPQGAGLDFSLRF